MIQGFFGGLAVKHPPVMQEAQVRSRGGEYPLEEAWQPTLVFCLENAMDRGGWQAIIHRVVKSQTQLK